MSVVFVGVPKRTEKIPLKQRPKTVQCSATSQRTGERCKQRVEEGHTVCLWHGGNAPQVKRAAEARLLQARARLRAETGDVEPRTPSEALLAAVRDADALLQCLKAEVDDSGRLSPAYVTAIGDALDRVGRLSKLALDSNIEERQIRLDERYGNAWAEVVKLILSRLGLSEYQWTIADAVVRQSVRDIEFRVNGKALPAPPAPDGATR